MSVEKDFKEFIELLNKNEVKYLVVGGFAFAYHVKPRFTKDIDFFVEPSKENSQKIMETLRQFGFGKTGLTEEDFQEPDQIILFGNSPMRIDIITSISGVEFEDAWQNKEEGKYGDIPCFFISMADLIRNKKASGRPQDITDLKLLEKFDKKQGLKPVRRLKR